MPTIKQLCGEFGVNCQCEWVHRVCSVRASGLCNIQPFWSAYLLFASSHFTVDMRVLSWFALLGANLAEQMWWQKHEWFTSTAARFEHDDSNAKQAGYLLMTILTWHWYPNNHILRVVLAQLDFFLLHTKQIIPSSMVRAAELSSYHWTMHWCNQNMRIMSFQSCFHCWLCWGKSWHLGISKKF